MSRPRSGAADGGAGKGAVIQHTFHSGRAIGVLAVGVLAFGAWRLHVAHESERTRAARPRMTAASYTQVARAIAALGGMVVPSAEQLGDRLTLEPDAPSSAPSAPPAPVADAPSLWQAIDGDAPMLAGLVNGFVGEAQRVRVVREALSELAPGSLVPIELPGGRRYLARVEDLTAHDNGDRSWSGHLEGYGQLFPVIYTQGDVATFGTLATPVGLYALEASGEDGVLFRDQREGLQDPSRECELIPD